MHNALGHSQHVRSEKLTSVCRTLRPKEDVDGERPEGPSCLPRKRKDRLAKGEFGERGMFRYELLKPNHMFAPE